MKERKSIMKVSLSLSLKPDAAGACEVLLKALKRANGKVMTMRAKSGIYILPKYFNNGEVADLSNKRVRTQEINAHEQQRARLAALCAHIEDALKQTPDAEVGGDWFRQVVDAFHNPDKYAGGADKSLKGMLEDFCATRSYSKKSESVFWTHAHVLLRYELFVQMTENKGYKFNPQLVTADDVEDFLSYAKHEAELIAEQPATFRRILAEYPRRDRGVREKSGNTMSKLFAALKTFFTWLNDTEQCTNNPFKRVKIERERYGTPYYLTMDEVRLVLTAQMPDKKTAVQRDIFVFQCLCGCRVGDLMTFTEAHINGGFLTYTPHKTKDKGETPRVADVPLNDTALALIDKYRGVDRRGRLFPCTTIEIYNAMIKRTIKAAGITRKVEVRNPLSGENELRPLHEVASSHMARRTFIGNAYALVQDPNIICKMSGHVEGSQAFNRYRNIDREMTRNIVNKLF